MYHLSGNDCFDARLFVSYLFCKFQSDCRTRVNSGRSHLVSKLTRTEVNSYPSQLASKLTRTPSEAVATIIHRVPCILLSLKSCHNQRDPTRRSACIIFDASSSNIWYLDHQYTTSAWILHTLTNLIIAPPPKKTPRFKIDWMIFIRPAPVIKRNPLLDDTPKTTHKCLPSLAL